MKKTILTLAAIACTFSMFAQPKLTKDNIDEVLKAMTLEEKASLCVGGATAGIFNGVTSGRTELVPGAAGNTRAIDRLGIPATVLADGPAGLRIDPTRAGDSNTYYCTGFPIGTLLASSWDVDLVKKVTTAMGNEVLEYGADVLLAPGMNIHRNPLNGRNFEYFSEDPVLSGNIAAAYVNGIQSQGVGVSSKHFALNNQETNRNEDDAIVGERALREIYLKNFEIMVRKSSPWTIMSSYNKLNGEYTQQKADLLTSALRDDWGYKGIVMTDWGNKDNTVKAVNAQNDLMEPGNQNEIDRIVEGVKNGTIPMENLDRNVRNLLTYIVKTPRFNGYKYSNKPDLKAHAQIARETAAEAMVLLRNEENTLPLSKDIKKVALYGVSSIDFVAGGMGSGDVNKPYVVNLVQALQGAGFTLDENLLKFYESHVAHSNAITDMTVDPSLSPEMLRIVNMITVHKLSEVALPDKAVKYQAASNDAAIVVIGRNAGEGEDRKLVDDFELTSIERDLISSVANEYHQQNKKIIVVLNVGGVIETASWKNLVDAILVPWSPGQEGANSVVDVITGKVNPTGKLPMTFPIAYFDTPSSYNFPYNYERFGKSIMDEGPLAHMKGEPQPQKDVDYTEYKEGIWVGYRYFEKASKEVSYPFGFGLSYTDYSYSAPVVKATKDGGFTASITVKNTGKVAGKEAVQVYVSAPEAGLSKPEKELKAFAKTKMLQPGESQTLSFEVYAYELASFNADASQWETAAGTYTVKFAASSADVRQTGSFKLAKPQTFPVAKAHANAPVQKLDELNL